jgi:hypothetical protein
VRSKLSLIKAYQKDPSPPWSPHIAMWFEKGGGENM